MSAITSRRAPPPQGGLARLVSKFENLGASSKPNRNIGGAHEVRHHPTIISKPPSASSEHDQVQDSMAQASRTVASPSLRLNSAFLATHDGAAQLEPPVGDDHDGDAVTPSSKVGRLISRRGSVVADLRRLFERGPGENAASKIAPTPTYEPKHVASPITMNECYDHKPSSFANSPGKGSLEIGTSSTGTGGPAKIDQQEERDVVPDLVSLHSHIERPEYLPRPLASVNRSSPRRPEQGSSVGVESKKSIWQRGTEPRFKLQGGVFLHKNPTPLKNMIVTEMGAWCPKPRDTSPEVVPHSEKASSKNEPKDSSLEQGERSGPDLLETLQPYIPLCHPCQDALLSSTAHAAGDLKGLHKSKGPSLPTSRSVPSYQSKVSSLRRKFDSSLSSSDEQPLVQSKGIKTDPTSRLSRPETPLRSSPSRQGPARHTSRLDGSLPTQSRASSANRGLKETIGLFESMSHQTNREDRFGHIPKAYSSPVFVKSAVTESNFHSDKQHEEAATEAWDLPLSPRLLSPVENGPRRSYSRSSGMDSISSQASDVKPLLYIKPSTLRESRHGRSFGAKIRSDWRRKMKSSSGDSERHSYPAQRQGFNVDGEGGTDSQQQYWVKSCEQMSTNDCEAFSGERKLGIVDRHPSLRLLGRRLISRSHGLFVSQAHCTLEQPQPIRGREIRRLTSLCRDRMAALRTRAQTE
ncbi:hypothetical protein V8C37DRAFT_409923 [Trichoderma ceciliae]